MAESTARVGYEANGGFLTGFAARRNGAELPPLPTRDSTLPIVAPLALARADVPIHASCYCRLETAAHH